jgi:DNA-binding response OmpR family regulator
MAKEQQTGNAAMPVVFVVDDEPLLLDLVAMILEPEGFDVKIYRDPLRAMAEYATFQPPPSLVITDYAMTGANGLEVIRACHKLNPRQKTMLVSGTVDESVYANSDVKPDTFIPKPYNADTLVAEVRALTGKG